MSLANEWTDGEDSIANTKSHHRSPDRDIDPKDQPHFDFSASVTERAPRPLWRFGHSRHGSNMLRKQRPRRQPRRT
jgi:hypothetical protein